MSMAATAVAVTAVGAGAQIYGGIQASNAARRAAGAQADAANAWLGDIHQKENDALGKIQTPQALAAYDTALHSQERNVQRMESLAQSLDPALVEAGKQTTQLLQGKSAPVLGQIQAQRDLERKQMLDNLRTQIGPGAETSSAGIQAMQQFDMQTATMMNQVQQQYLNQVSGLAIGGSQTIGDTLSKVNATLTDIQKNSPGAQAADLMARFTAAENGAQEAKVNAAGGQYAGDQILGQTIGNVGGGLMSVGAMYGAANMMKTPSAPGTPPGGGNLVAGVGENAQFTMPELGSQYAGAPGNPSLLGGAVNPPAQSVARVGGGSAGVGIPSAPSYLPFSANYGGAGNYNMNPKTWPVGNEIYSMPFDSGSAGKIVGGN